MTSSTIEYLYDCALEPDRWQCALDAVVCDMGARAAILLVRDFRAGPWSLNHLCSVYSDMFARGAGAVYVEKFAHLEEQQVAALEGLRVLDMVADTDLGVDRQTLDSRADYGFLAREIGIRRRLVSRLNDKPGWFDLIAVAFDHAVEAPSNRARAALGDHLPHIAKSIEIERTFTDLRQRYNAVLNVLDRIRIGIILALNDGEILLANAEAERLLSDRDGLRRTPLNTTACDDPDQSAAFQAHIAAVALTSRGEGDVAGRQMRVDRRSGGTPLLVDFAPIRDASDELNERFTGAIALVVDPDRTEDLRIDPFAALFDLTGAEAAVCELMLRGHSAPEIAEARGRSVETVRNQIKAVYAKTETRDRGSLVRLVVRTLPPVI